MRVSLFSSPKTIVTALIILVLFVASFNSVLVSAQKEDLPSGLPRIDVLPESRAALRGESYVINVTVYSGKPANVSLSWRACAGVKVNLLNNTNTTRNIILGAVRVLLFKFNVTVEQTAVGNITISFLLKSNITGTDLIKNHTVKVLLARNVKFNLTKKLANQEINIAVHCGDSKLFSFTGKVDKDGMFLVKQEVPALNKLCNLSAILRTDLGAFLANETIGVELEKLLNTTIHPGYLINITLNTLTIEGRNIESRNLFANINADNKNILLDLSVKRSIFLGISEKEEEKKVNITIEIRTKNIYLLNISQVKIKKEGRSIGVYLNEKRLPQIDESTMLNIIVPVTNITFGLYYLDKGGYAKLTSGVVRLVEVKVPLAYDGSTRNFSERVKNGLKEGVIVVKEYNSTLAKINITIEFAGMKAACDEVPLANGTSFKCNDVEARLCLEEGNAAIVVNTMSSSIHGQIEFADLSQRILYWGTVKIPRVPKNASGKLKLEPFSVAFECTSEQIETGGYVCEGRVFLWPLALWPFQPKRITGELHVDGETYRLEMEPVRVYAGVWGFALVAIAVIAVVVAILVRRPAARFLREELEIYDEHYDLG